MRILHIDTGREMRGGQYQVMLLMKGLRDEGHDCVLLARAESPLSVIAGEAGFPVYPANVRELWQRSKAVEIVHAHDARAHSIAAIAAQKRFVVSRRVSFPVQHTLLSKLKYERAARYVAISRFVAGELYKAGVSCELVDVVFDAVESQDDGAAWDSRNPVVAPAFRNDAKKLSELTQSACRLAGVDLVMSNSLPRDLRKASMFVYLTKSEGLGSAALLAMSAGVPVIASRVEGLREVFEHDRSGLYVDNSAPQVASAIQRLLTEPTLASRLTCAARTRVQECFSAARLVNETVRSYERAVAG